MTTNAPTNLAIGSNNFTQTFAPTGEQVESLPAVASALERLLASQETVDAGRVEALADEVRARQRPRRSRIGTN